MRLPSSISHERILEAVGLALAACMALYVVLESRALPFGLRTEALAVAAGVLAVGVLAGRLMPASSAGPIAYAAEDKILAVSLAYGLLLTGFLFVIVEVPPALLSLYVLPIFVGAFSLQERVVFGETVLTLASLLFLRGADWIYGPFFDTALVLQLAVLGTVSGLMILLTAALRARRDETRDLSLALSRRLDQIQVIGALVRHGEFFSRIDEALARIDEVVARAFDAEKCGVFLVDAESGALRLQPESVGLGPQECELLRVDSNISLFQETLSAGVPVRFEEDGLTRAGFVGFVALKNLLAVPLRARDVAIGVLFIANRRGGAFGDEDARYAELVSGFVAALIDSSRSYERVLKEKRNVDTMAHLMIGRELRMRELKQDLKKRPGL